MNDIVFWQERGGFLFFGVIILFALYAMLARARRRTLLFIMNEKVREASGAKRSAALFWARTLSMALAFIFATFAMMQPHIVPSGAKEGAKLEEVSELAFLLDVSQSMGVADTAAREKRFDRAREIISAIVEGIGGVPISLSCFAGNLELEVPPTLDYLYFHTALEASAIGDTLVLGTNFFALFESLEKNMRLASREKKVHYILFSDGEDTCGAKQEAILEKVAALARAGSRLDVVGLGTLQGGPVPGLPVVSKLDRSFLERLAREGRGRCFLELEMSMPLLVDQLRASSLFCEEKIERKPVGVSLATYPLVSAALFLLIALFIPSRFRTLSLFCVVLTPSLFGGENFDQGDQGMNAYHAHKYAEARSYFEKEAARSSSPEVRACMLYNSGSAWLAEGLFSEALQSFRAIDSRFITSRAVRAALVCNQAYALLQEARGAPRELMEELFASLDALKGSFEATMQERVGEEEALIRAAHILQKYSSRAATLFTLERQLIAILDVAPSLLYAQAISEAARLPLISSNAIQLLEALDRARFEKEVIGAGGDEIESALTLCLEAETMSELLGGQSLWNVLLGWRRTLFEERLQKKIAAGDAVAGSLEPMISHYSFKELQHYYSCMKMPLDRLFRAVFEEPSGLAVQALWERQGRTGHPSVISQMEVVTQWSLAFAAGALSYLLDVAEKVPNPANISYVKEAWQYYRKDLHAEKIQFVEKLFTELEACTDVSCSRLSLRAITMTLFFEEKVAQDQQGAILSGCEFETMAAAYTGAHPELFMTVTEETFRALSGVVVPKELRSQIEQFLSLEISQDGGSFVSNYYHDRARELLEKILTFLQKEVQRRPVPPEAQARTPMLSPDAAIRLSQEMGRDDTMFQKEAKEHIGGDRPW